MWHILGTGDSIFNNSKKGVNGQVNNLLSMLTVSWKYDLNMCAHINELILSPSLSETESM